MKIIHNEKKSKSNGYLVIFKDWKKFLVIDITLNGKWVDCSLITYKYFFENTYLKMFLILVVG